MHKNFAIKGHPTRNKEVVEILEMMGGKSTIPIGATLNKSVYTIIEGEIFEIPHYNIQYYDFIIFTLEEFLKKFPYKVGDKVKLYYQDEENDGYCSSISSTIIGMRWDKSHGVVAYKMEGIDREFYKQEFTYNKDEPDAVIAGINLNRADYADEVEINLGDYEIEVRNGRTFAVLKKPKYPTTYKGCRGMLDDYNIGNGSSYKASLFASLKDLFVCRNAYWKIYGEETGLGKPWEPDWNNDYSEKYCIIVEDGVISKCTFRTTQFILAFPTKEIRDMFLENFRDLIEKCKELL